MSKVTDVLFRGTYDGKDVEDELKGTENVAKNAATVMEAALVGAMVKFGGSASNAALEFDLSMNNVKALTGATSEEMIILEQLSKDMGSSTAFSAKEAADAMGFLAMAGFDVNAIISSLPDVLAMATAGQLGLAEAADITSNILSAFGLEADEAGRVADILAASASNANTSVAQMGKAMSFVAPVAKDMGLSMEETAAIIMVMADAGIQGGKAGTALRSALIDLGLAGEEVGEIVEGFTEELNKMEDGLDDGETLNFIHGLQALDLALQDADDATRAKVKSDLFAKSAISGMSVVTDEANGKLADYIDILEESEGAAQSMADVIMEGAVGIRTEMDSTFDTLQVEIGQLINTVLAPLWKILTMIMQGFMALPAPVQAFIVAIVALTTALAAVNIAKRTLGFLTKGLLPMMLNMGKTVSMIIKPFVFLGKSIWTIVPALWAKVAAMAASTATFIANTAAMIAQKAVMVILNTWTALVTAAQWLWNIAMTANPIGIIIMLITGFILILILMREEIVAAVEGIIEFWMQFEIVQRMVENVSEKIESMIGIISFLITTVSEAWAAFNEWFFSLEKVQGIMASVNGAIESMKGFLQSTTEAVKGFVNAWRDFFTFPWNKVDASSVPGGGGPSGIQGGFSQGLSMLSGAGTLSANTPFGVGSVGSASSSGTGSNFSNGITAKVSVPLNLNGSKIGQAVIDVVQTNLKN